MFWNKRNRKRSANANAAINWVIIGMVGLAIITHFSNEKGDISVTLPDAANSTAKNTMANLKQYKGKILPDDSQPLTLQDEKLGEGAPAICGQNVKIAYKAFDKDDAAIEDEATEDKPLAFTIGDKKAMPAFEEGVVGMRVGGVRKLFAPPAYAYAAPGFAHGSLPTASTVTFEAQLLEITPLLPDPSETSYRFIENRNGLGSALNCGDTASFNVTVWAMDGSKIFTTTGEGKEPITLTPGSSSHFSGLEIAALGMRPGGKRTVVVPPPFQKRLDQGAEPLEIPFPKNQTVLVDIDWVQ